MIASLMLATLAALTPAQAAGMTPAALGDALLAPGHLPIVDKALPPSLVPPPPGRPTRTVVRLYAAARAAAEPGFCEQTVYEVQLAPVFRGADGALPPAPADEVETSATYRLKPRGAGASCEADRSDFFRLLAPGDAAPVFAAVRLLDRAVRAVARNRRPGFTGRVDDELARSTRALAAADPELAADIRQGSPDWLVPATDWRRALARFDASAISYYAPEQSAPSSSPTIAFSGRDYWTATLTIVDGRVADVLMRRAIPPPF